MVKLIACDLDGTLLLNGAQELNPGTVDQIRKLLSQGRVFAAASGRQYPNLRRLFAGVEDDIAYICENGALVIYKGEILEKHIIERAKGQELLKMIMEKEGAEALLSGVNTCYIQPKDPAYAVHLRDVVKNQVTVVDDILKTEEPYLKISVYEKDGVEASRKYWEKKLAGKAAVAVSGREWLDTMPFGVHKGTALECLMRYLGASARETAAFGDNYNDLEMLKTAGLSFAMEKAPEEVKDCSRYVTSLVEDTFAEISGGKYD
ncbi:MAG TPA: HAD family hydrolase [Candidatus Limivivens intestinipullorum]|uniref:HAD family hydrolase n=1 Tax=Candidatus Limivivens intestinipullorum TaxID=2840858 RepID=A0A9D1EVD8_9FIRM|nr:HAD family hydrolase [Candidatus Limivivens intestinipullorum]